MERKSHARQQFKPLQEPRPYSDDLSDSERDLWIDTVCKGFVATGQANKEYYKVILETLWPVGHGIPGPHITETQLREAIDNYRRSKRKGSEPYKPYIDAFRRVRELHGEEGVTGLTRYGRMCQLIDLSLGEKRSPRKKLTKKEWLQLLEDYNNKCAVCSRSSEEFKFQQDHKIPRVRGGGDDLGNWQPLCTECNNFKSTACRGCQLDCNKCPWAYPETYSLLRLLPENVEKITVLAREQNVNPNELLNFIVAKYPATE